MSARRSQCGPFWILLPQGGRTRTSSSNTNAVGLRRRRASKRKPSSSCVSQNQQPKKAADSYGVWGALGAGSCSSVSWRSFLLPRLRELRSTSTSPSTLRGSAWMTKTCLHNGNLATTPATRCRLAWLPLQEYLVCLLHGLLKNGTGSLERC